MNDLKDSPKKNGLEKQEKIGDKKEKTSEKAVINPENSDSVSSTKEENNSEHLHRRFKFLKNALDKVFKKCSSAGKYSWYQEVFPTLNLKKPTELKHIQEQVIKQLTENIQMEAKLMLEEENIEQLMNNLDVLISKAPAPPNTSVWRPSGNVQEDVRAHLIPDRKKFHDNLKDLLKNLEQENKQLKDVVAHRHKHLLKTKDKLDEHNAFFTKIVHTTEKIQKSFEATTDNPI